MISAFNKHADDPKNRRLAMKRGGWSELLKATGSRRFCKTGLSMQAHTYDRVEEHSYRKYVAIAGKMLAGISRHDSSASGSLLQVTTAV